MAVILLCNIPLLIAFYPGIVAWDCEYELEMALGYIPTTSHHPPLHALLLGALWNATGENGLFFLVILQFFLYAYAAARIIETATNLGLRKEIGLAFVVFAGVFPFSISRELSFYKDALFLSFMMLLACELTNLAFNPQKERRLRLKTQICVVVFSLLVIALRNDGIYIVIALMAITATLSKQSRRIATISATWSMWAGYLAPRFSNLNGHEEDTFQLVPRSDYDENALIEAESPEWSAPLCSLYTLYCKGWLKVPVFSTLADPGIYTWVLAISLFCLLRTRKKRFREELLALAPSFLILGICLLSPVATCMRYYLPIVMLTPLVLGAVANTKCISDSSAR